MNNLPKIIIKDGYDIDESGNLNSVTMSDNVDTVTAPTSVTTYASTVNWIPSNSSTLTEFSAPNLGSITTTLFGGYNQVTQLNLPSLRTINTYIGNYTGVFTSNNIAEIDMPKLTNISVWGSYPSWNGVFYTCNNLTNVNFPALQTISTNAASYIFYNCTGLISAQFPHITTISGYLLNYCTTLQEVQLGSVGYPVTNINNNAFAGCTQSGLTITVYTTNGAALSGSPWRATNADVEFVEA